MHSLPRRFALPGRFALAAALLVQAGCSGASLPAGLPSPDANVFPGFDAWMYPGDAALRTWRSESPYRWVGYYLASPCHRDASWMGRRAAIQAMGWGTAVLYVGQQAFEGESAENPGVEQILCSRTLLAEEQARLDARDAAAKAASEGFPLGSVVFLDVERMDRVPPEMVTYLRTWAGELLEDGRFLPGLYAHRENAAELYLVAAYAYRDAGREMGPPFWVAGGSGFDLGRSPQAAGLPFVDIWQGVLDVERTWGGITLQVDENVADRASPSEPRGE